MTFSIKCDRRKLLITLKSNAQQLEISVELSCLRCIALQRPTSFTTLESSLNVTVMDGYDNNYNHFTDYHHQPSDSIISTKFSIDPERRAVYLR